MNESFGSATYAPEGCCTSPEDGISGCTVVTGLSTSTADVLTPTVGAPVLPTSTADVPALELGVSVFFRAGTAGVLNTGTDIRHAFRRQSRVLTPCSVSTAGGISKTDRLEPF